MKNITLLKLECKKAMRTKGFAIALFLGIVVVSLQTAWVINNTYSVNNEMFEDISHSTYMDSDYGYWYEMGIMEGWIGTECFSPYNNIYFLIFPLLAAMAFGISFYDEWSSGYISQVITRCSRSKFFICKYTATFLSGGTVTTIPLIFSMILSACYLPAISTDPMALQANVSEGELWGELFYTNPLLYAVCYICLDFIYGGIFACLVLAFSKWFNNRFAAVIFPMILNITLYYGIDNIFVAFRKYNMSIFINPQQSISAHNIVSVSIVTIIMILLTLLLFICGNKKRDVLN